MEQVGETTAEKRAHTDASLGVERASADAADRVASKAQRALDDLIERDRILADDRLLKFRQNADGVLERERSASPPKDNSVAIERRAADAVKKAERIVTDALLDGERHRADAVTEKERRERVAERESVQMQRKETNNQLSTERNDSDVAATVLVETEGALARSIGAHARGSDVMGMVAHDLRSPLSVIAINSEHIAELTKEGPAHEAADDIMGAAARMARILADLLDVARIESGTLHILKRQHDVGMLVSEILRTYAPLFVSRRLTFLARAPEPPVVAFFDHDRIIQVLSNLLGNAMKFASVGGTIDFHVEQRAEEVEFVLRDDGPGIAPTALPHIFKRFWQIDNIERRGLGLGLHICEQIVVGHGGRIWVDSEFGKGATFRFTLPKR